MPGGSRKTKNGWSCATCTFYHSAPSGQRCSMCHALRVSKQQMADFIQGIPIPKQQPQGDCSNNNNTMKNGNASSASSSSVLAKTKPAKKRQRRTSEQQTQTTTTLLELDAIAASALENTSSNGGAGGGGDVADDLTTQSKILPAGTATCAAASSPSWNGNMTFASSSAAAPLVDDTSVVTGANTLHRQDNNNNNINSAVAMFPPPKRQQKPPPQPSLLLLQNNQQQQLQQKRRAQRQQQYQPQNQNQNQPRSTILVPSLPFSPGPVPFNPETARDWIFPLCSTSSSRHATGSTCSGDAVGVGFSKRQYQVDICATAVRHNTLVSLPTGLGKTLIAAVVLYNYHRWFPTGKCIFLATTLPLVQQQVQACFDVMGISVHDTAVLTGKMSPERRADIWKSKSVFFCTPQTVQKDLEAHRLDARQVVCLVLDEAHRATGDYAYCKIVQHLLNIQNGNDTDSTENNQNNDTATAAAAAAPLAKFRLLGLSATPGSTIKAIQAVIDALHINKVEARCDDDADVKQYTHERQYEVIVVPIVSACRDVERMLNDIIGTLLDHLRSRGVFQQHGNATVAQFSVFSSIKNYEQKHGKNADPLGVLPTFYAALKLVGIRSDVHAQGIGVVRSKLLQLKNEPQRGLLKTIVHGPAFQAVWDLVERSTTFSCSSSSSNNPNSGNDGSSNNNKNNKNMSIADKLVNNPKLVKLREILTVHFQQARALGQSSRVIVFAQRRDCIAEIVYILQDLAPMIRSRYFVGQAKGSNDDTTSATTGAATTTEQQQQVKGMRQAEQHEAIRQFRDNVFNVLVCTCIGEEGLDIGEVDLIVNFEVVKSAIRSIQRVGRTGRKRDGRVVWLVSEGAEQRTFAECKQKERTLGHALKNPNSFSVVPTVPMLPDDPVLCERSMNVSSNSHMSQVEGHAEQAKKKKVMMKCQQPRQFSCAGAGATRTTTTATKTSSAATPARRKSWRISTDALARRASVLGLSNRISTYSIAAMKRRIILARRQQQQQRQSTSRSSRATLGHCRLGRTTSLLCQFEENNNNIMQESAKVAEISRYRVAGAGRSSDLSLDAFFPLTSSEEHFSKLAWGSTKVPPPPPPPPNSTDAVADHDSSCRTNVLMHTVPNTTSKIALLGEGVALAVSHGGAATREPSQMTTRLPVINPYSRITPATIQRVPSHCGMEMSNLAEGWKSSVLPTAEEFQLPTPEPSSGEESSDDCDDNDAPCVDFASGIAVLESTEPKNHHCSASNTASRSAADLNHRDQVDSVGFPPQDAFTHDDGAAGVLSLNELNHYLAPEKFSGQEGDIEQVPHEVASVPVPAATKEVEASELNQHHASKSESFGLEAAHETIDEGDAFILPPQDSSSSDDEDSDEDEGGFDDNTNLSTLQAPRVKASAETETAAVEHSPTDYHPKVRFSIGTSTAFTADSFNRHSLKPDPDDGTECLHVRRQERKTRTIVDTPDDSLSMTEHSAVKPQSKPEVRFSLDTTFTADSLNHHSLEPDLEESAEFLHVRRQGRKTRTIVDTPDTTSRTVENNHRFSIGSLENPLLDTQESARKESVPSSDIDDIVCAICGSGASPEFDPIVLCDGPGGSTVCDLAVHGTCYSATINFNKEWRCDVCLYRFSGGTNRVRCLVCNKHTGALKRLDGDDWIHSSCRNGDAPITTAAAASKQPRLKKIGRAITKVAGETQETGKKRTALSDVPVNVSKPAVAAANKKKQRRDYCRFLDDEASIDTDDDIDGDEDEEDLLAIDGEEGKHDSFINDSSQLGVFTQDDLDKVDNDLHDDDVDKEEDATHRAVDAERERMNAFATPLLHRRQKRTDDISPDDNSSSVPSSERGLGKLHFIRSVMEHHRQGGRAEDIEQFFEELAEDEGGETQVENDD